MARVFNTGNLGSSDVGVNYVTRQLSGSLKQARFTFTGTYTGVTGRIEASNTGAAGSFVPLATVHEDTGAGFNGSISNANFSVLANVAGWSFVRFNPTAIGSGTLTVDIDQVTSDTPLGVKSISLNYVAQVITSAGANALSVGAGGTTNPAFNVDASASSQATGWGIVGAAAAGGAALTVLSSGTNENGTIDAKGSGTLTLQGTATGAISLARNTSVTGTGTITSASAIALTVGLNGATNPAFQVDASTASSATGIKVKSAAATGGVALSVISSGTNENLTADAKGSGTIQIGGTSTGNVKLGGGGGIVVLPGTLTGGGLLTCALQVATSGPLIYSGSGAPSISAAVKGSLYLRSDGGATNTRAYIATDTAGTWTALTTAA